VHTFGGEHSGHARSPCTQPLHNAIQPVPQPCGGANASRKFLGKSYDKTTAEGSFYSIHQEQKYQEQNHHEHQD
jgi:hypothetical protein